MQVAEVMTRGVVAARPETPLKEVARLLAGHRVSGAPVVDASNRVVGVISEADFLAKEQGEVAERHPWLAWLLGRAGSIREQIAKLEATTAGEAMSAPPITIEADASITEAAALMAARRVNRLPVTREGTLVGIITRADLMASYLRPDDEIDAAVQREVLAETMWLPPGTVTVHVDEGIVRLSGQVDRRSTAEITARLTAAVDGVIGVDDRLSWDLDDREVEATGRTVYEPGAASVSAREHPGHL